MIDATLSELIRLLSSGAVWCAIAQSAASHFAAAPTDYAITTPVRYAGSTAGATVVVRRWDWPKRRGDVVHREITTLRPDGSDASVRVPIRASLATLPSNMTAARGSDGFVATENAWWYATLDEHDGSAAVTFVKSDGSRTTHPRPFPGSSVQWSLVAVPAREPRALEITLTGDTFVDQATVIRELDWSGARRSWRLPQVSLTEPFKTAELLPDGRVALFSKEAGLSMYLLGDEGNVETVVLRNVRIRHFDTAIDVAGQIAIAAARMDEPLIDAVVADVATLHSADWYSLTREALVPGRLRELQVVATMRGFVAAWVNERDGRRIEATELGTRAPGAARGAARVEIGQPAARGHEVFFDVQPIGDELLFWWDDGERLVERRLPLSLAGYALIDEMQRRFCAPATVEPR